MGVPVLFLLSAFAATPSVHAAAFLPVSHGPRPVVAVDHDNGGCPWMPFSGTSTPRTAAPPLTPLSTALMAKGKKVSMAEKRRQRAKRLPARPVTSTPRRPESKAPPNPHQVEASSSSVEAKDTAASEATTPSSSSSSSTAAAVGSDEDYAEGIETKAQQLLKSQRKSVAMLTLVRERLEALPAAEIQSALQQKGFWYSDSGDSGDSDTGPDTGNGFLQSQTISNELQREGVTLYESGAMSVDMDRLAAGEYSCLLAGGPDQYAACPRSIELVVSTTKHLNKAVLESKDVSASAGVVLDDTKCMASMRTFDRQAWKAAQVLLTGKSTPTGTYDTDQDGNNSANTGSNDDDASSVTRPFERTVTNDIDGQKDRRKISLCYYLVPENWSHGGDMVFQQKAANDGETTEVHVPALRDRLVVWKSDTALHRQEPWNGSDDMPLASCIELHLIEKA
jgi:hypothetical protein